MAEQEQDRRRGTAEQNLAKIVDAAEHLLREGRPASISAVAEEAGLSRVTVYAHFENRTRLLEAVVERAVKTSVEAIEAAEPESGPPVEALRRLLATGWEELGRNEELAQASAAELSAEAMRRSHRAVRGAIERLAERGRVDGSFRTDVGTGWLVTGCLALMHAAAEEVRIGSLTPEQALDALSLTVVDYFTGT